MATSSGCTRCSAANWASPPASTGCGGNWGTAGEGEETLQEHRRPHGDDLQAGPRQRVFANASDGFAALIAWADRHAGSHPLHFGMEATGPYSHGLATHRHAAGRVVSVVNPTRGELRHRLGAATAAGAGDIRATADWLGLWQQSDAKSIEGDLRFAPRPDGPKAGPPTLDGIEQPSGAVPARVTGRE